MVEINVDNLVLEYEKNDTEANKTYAGKTVKVSGEIFFIGESHTGRPMILFNSTEGTRLRLGAYFNGSWGDEKALLIEGTPATIEGIIKEKEYGDIIELMGEKITNFGFTILMK
jgi:tRNA_anti-like